MKPLFEEIYIPAKTSASASAQRKLTAAVVDMPTSSSTPNVALMPTLGLGEGGEEGPNVGEKRIREENPSASASASVSSSQQAKIKRQKIDRKASFSNEISEQSAASTSTMVRGK